MKLHSILSLGLQKSQSMNRKVFKKGFTLIEVMVALAILGIAITVIVELFSGNLRLARKSEDFSRAVFYGRQLLEELCLKQKFPKNVEEGTFEGNFRWKYEIEPVTLVDEEQEEKFPLEVFKIKVSVYWPAKDKEKTLTFETLKTLVKNEEFPWNTKMALKQKRK